MRVGVISDTHGLLRPEAIDALRGSELILHAGDVGDRRVLERLRAIAPTRAVRGNVDGGEWTIALPATEVVTVGTLQIYMLHDIGSLDIDPKAAGISAVIYGHSHKPSVEMRDGVLYLNPGAAGPRRFSLPVSVARLEISGTRLSHEIVELCI